MALKAGQPNAQCFPNNEHSKKKIFFCSCSSKLSPSWLLFLRCYNSVTKESNATWACPSLPTPIAVMLLFQLEHKTIPCILHPACMWACTGMLAAINTLCSATSACQGNSHVPQGKTKEKNLNKQKTNELFSNSKYLKFPI